MSGYTDGNPLNLAVGKYKHINLLSAVGGIVFAAASAVQFLGADLSIAHPSWSFPTGQTAVFLSLAVLLMAFATSDTTDWEYYEMHEQAVIGGAVVAMIVDQYDVLGLASMISNIQPLSGWLFFGLSMAAWAILSR